MKRAASQVQDVIVCGEVIAKILGEAIEPLLSLLFGLEKSRLPQDAQVLGNVVLGQLEALRDVVDAVLPLQEDPDDPHPVLLPKRFQCRNTVKLLHEILYTRVGRPIKSAGPECDARVRRRA